MKSALLALTLLTAASAQMAHAGPMISGGGFAELVASCSSSAYDVSIVQYDQNTVFRVRAADAGVEDANLAIGNVSAVTPNSDYQSAYADASGQLQVGLLKAVPGQDRKMVLIHVQLDNGTVLNGVSVDCSYPVAPKQ